MSQLLQMSELVQLDAQGPGGPYRARRRMTVQDVAGTPIAELSLVPRLFVERSLAALRQADDMPADERAAALARAGQMFATESIDGMGPDEYAHMVSRVCGMPISVVRDAMHDVAHAATEAYRSTQQARPVGAVNDWRDPSTRRGRAVWTRRGDVFGVLAAGNHPAVHALWLQTLALGYRIAVRPSTREPFTPHRLITALRAAGFADHVALLPTDHATADDLIRGADLALVYGGDEVARKYGDHPSVLPQGPGRSKILVSTDDWRSHLDTIVASVSEHAGTACINTTAVFVDGDPTPVAAALAERLSSMPSLPPKDERAKLPVQPMATAKAVEALLLRHADGATPWLGGDGIVDDLGDGSAVLRPAVFQVDRPDAPQTSVELGFPCVWVAPWSHADGIGPLRQTLVLTAITDDEQLIERLVNEPSISNVYVGNHSTYWMHVDVPHDGYLAEFLMRTKAVIRD
jgi:acyl-CoA reductase-like NAD-dependent aldehyde dehydrogenase